MRQTQRAAQIDDGDLLAPQGGKPADPRTKKPIEIGRRHGRTQVVRGEDGTKHRRVNRKIIAGDPEGEILAGLNVHVRLIGERVGKVKSRESTQMNHSFATE